MHKIKINGVSLTEDRKIIRWSVSEQEKQGDKIVDVPRGEGTTAVSREATVEEVQAAIEPEVQKLLALSAKAKEEREKLQAAYDAGYEAAMKEKLDKVDNSGQDDDS